MQRIEDLETPVVLIDMDVVDRNVAAAQAQFDALGVAFRPHIKTHKLPELALMQLAAGAKGIAAQKLSEAEVFADAGFDDILLCTTPLSPGKIARTRAMAARIALAVVVDSARAVDLLAATPGADLRLLVECDTGGARCGVQSPEAARDLAAKIDAAPGLTFGGLMTYPAPGGTAVVQDFMSRARALCLDAIGHCAVISSGGTPSLSDAALAPVVTEYRAGTYIYNDRSLVARGAVGVQDCALTVLATVLSRPTDARAILDTGSKALTSDLFGMQGFGLIADWPGAAIVSLSEEHGVVQLAGQTPAVGAKVQIIPNHACPVSNLFDTVVLHRGGVVETTLTVAARGKVQ